jgi:hypothetical protein
MGKEAIKIGKKSELVHGHKQVPISYGNWSANVDEGIAEFILAIWRCGIQTEMSCQENGPGVTWVSFRRTTDLRRFMKMLLDWSGFEDKIAQPAWSRADILKFGRWHSKVDIIEGWRWVSEDEIVPNGTILLGYSIRFPKSDMESVTKHLRKKAWDLEMERRMSL